MVGTRFDNLRTQQQELHLIQRKWLIFFQTVAIIPAQRNNDGEDRL